MSILTACDKSSGFLHYSPWISKKDNYLCHVIIKSIYVMKKFRITYSQLTPMGLSSSHVYTREVWAKTSRGAQGIYNREIRRGQDSAYETTLLKIEEL